MTRMNSKTNQLNPTASSMPLAVGAVWRGFQRSGRKSYDVEVRIAGVDDKGDICGTLTIKHLLPTLPKVVTFFDGEIIGDHHSFATDKWGADDEDDQAHWGRFKRDIYLRRNSIDAGSGSDSEEDEEGYHSDEEDSTGHRSRCSSPGLRTRRKSDIPPNVVFMRLKERCFLNHDKEQDLSGASFDGFYYIAVEFNPAPDRPQLSVSQHSLSHHRGFAGGASEYMPHPLSGGTASLAGRSEKSRDILLDRVDLFSSSVPTPRSAFMSASTSTSSSGGIERSREIHTSDANLARPTWGSALSRMSSYASVVRGTLLGRDTQDADASDFRSNASLPGIYKPESETCGAIPDEVHHSVSHLSEVFSPSIEDFPFPPAPVASLTSSSASRNSTASIAQTFRPRSRSSSVRYTSGVGNALRAGLSRSSSSSARTRTSACGKANGALSTNFYNSKTGYRGAWAHATMRGFYFTPPPSANAGNGSDVDSTGAEDGALSSHDTDDASSYQELELFYVGDGHGAILEEYEAVRSGVDEWGNVRPSDEMQKIKQDFIRRENYAKPKASASFTVL